MPGAPGGVRGAGTVPPVEQWGGRRASDLAALAARAWPAEVPHLDDLASTCWAPGATVLATEGGLGAASIRVDLAAAGGRSVGWLLLLAVAPGARRAGVGRSLLAEAERWAFAQGAVEVRIDGTAPAWLWPGVDASMEAMRGLVEAAGYHPTGARPRVEVPATFRADAPSGVVVSRVLDDDVAGIVDGLVAHQRPEDRAALALAIEQAGVHVARDAASGDVVGVASQAPGRAGWAGPALVVPTWEGRGVEHALLSALATDVMVAGADRLVVVPGGPAGAGPYLAAGGTVTGEVIAYGKRRL